MKQHFHFIFCLESDNKRNRLDENVVSTCDATVIFRGSHEESEWHN